MKRFLMLFLPVAVALTAATAPFAQELDPRPTLQPDRIVLTWNDDPATTQAVTWRTNSSVLQGVAEIALADADPRFRFTATSVPAETTALKTESGTAHFHTVTFEGLEPNTLYAYRVGSGETNWSEWNQFRTASREAEPFRFIYVGDAQNDIFSLWSRTIREAYSEAPRARFIIHAGDLVNDAHSEVEWQEWFEAGDWIHSRIPSIPIPGNHEYTGLFKELSKQWRPQFALPHHENSDLDETTYVIDYQGVRIVGMNSNLTISAQAEWLDDVLGDNPNKWTVLTFHHPIFSAAEGRDNRKLRKSWKPVIDKYGVDLVLQGHDHAYGRGHNVPTGARAVDGEAGTVYVVSVSGRKMYEIPEDDAWRDRAGEGIQLFQVVDVSPEKLSYKAMTATGELYDAFEIVRGEGGVKRFVDLSEELGPERRRED